MVGTFSDHNKKQILKKYPLILLFAFFLFSACDKDEPGDTGPSGKLTEVASYGLDVKEASGLSFGPEKKTLLTVSDNTGRIYELSLEGKVLRTLNYKGDDLEGVTYDKENNEIAVVEERKRQIVFVDYDSGNELRRFDIDVEVVDNNKGLEGISWNKNNHSFYIVNEKRPSKLIVWKEGMGNISEITLNLGSDNSGIFVDSQRATVWVLSDESETLYECNYNGTKEKSFKLDINKPEGVVVDKENNRVYIVRDMFSKLFVLKFAE